MRRRELLVAGATIAIAGCSSEGEGPESEDNTTDLDGETGNQSEDGTDKVAEPDLSITDATTTTTSIQTGQSVDVEVTIKNAGDAAGQIELNLSANGESSIDSSTVDVGAGKSKTVTLSATFDEAGDVDLAVNGTAAGTISVEIPDEKQAKKLLETAQTHFANAAADIGDLSIDSEAVNQESMDEDFAAMQAALEDALELQLTGEQMATVNALEATEAAVRAVITAHTSLLDAGVHADVESALESFEGGDVPELPTETISTARSDVKTARQAVKDFDSGVLEYVNALESGDLSGQVDTLGSDIDAVEAVYNSFATIDSAEDTFWADYWAYYSLEEKEVREFAEDEFQTGADGIESGSEISLDVDAAVTYTDAMGDSAGDYTRASGAKIQGNDPSSYVDSGEEALDEAKAALEGRFDPEGNRQ